MERKTCIDSSEYITEMHRRSYFYWIFFYTLYDFSIACSDQKHEPLILFLSGQHQDISDMIRSSLVLIVNKKNIYQNKKHLCNYYCTITFNNKCIPGEAIHKRHRRHDIQNFISERWHHFS